MFVMWLNRKLNDVITQSQEQKNALKPAFLCFWCCVKQQNYLDSTVESLWDHNNHDPIQEFSEGQQA